MSSNDWSIDDLTLVAAYFNYDGLKVLTDDHEFCQRLATEIGWPAAGLEPQARMMRNIVRGSGGYENAGKNAHKVANEYVLYHQKSYDRANEIIEKENYDLPKLP